MNLYYDPDDPEECATEIVTLLDAIRKVMQKRDERIASLESDVESLADELDDAKALVMDRDETIKELESKITALEAEAE